MFRIMGNFSLEKILIYLVVLACFSNSARAEFFAELSYKLWNGDCPKDIHDPSPGLTSRYTPACKDFSSASRLKLMTTSYGKMAENAFLAGLAEVRARQLGCVQLQISNLQKSSEDQNQFINNFEATLSLLGIEKKHMLDIKRNPPLTKEMLAEYEKSRLRAAVLFESLPYKEIEPFRRVIDYVISQNENYEPDRIEGWLTKQTKQMLAQALSESAAEIAKNKKVLDNGASTLGLSLDRTAKESLAQDKDLIESFRNEHPEIQNELKPTVCRVDAKYGTGAQSRDRTLIAVSVLSSSGSFGLAKAGVALADSVTGAAAIGSISARTAGVLRVLTAANATAASLSQIHKTCFGQEVGLKSKYSVDGPSCDAHVLETQSSENCMVVAALNTLGFKAASNAAKQAFAEIKFGAEVVKDTTPQIAAIKLARIGKATKSENPFKNIEASFRNGSSSNVSQPKSVGEARENTGKENLKLMNERFPSVFKQIQEPATAN